MKLAGILGGMGPESTAEYYRLIGSIYSDRTQQRSFPPVLINSIDMRPVLELLASNRLPELTELLLREIRRLVNAGADFAAIASNTPHLVFSELNQLSPIPLISIVEVTCAVATNRQLRRVAILGSRTTMEGRFYPNVFEREGIRVVLPQSDERKYIHERYMGELVKGVVLDETRAGFLAIAQRMKLQDDIDAVILGGTELPLLLRETEYYGIPFLNTAQIHVDAIVSRMVLD